MKRFCGKCGKELKDGDQIKAMVLSVFRQISSSVSYAIEKPYECITIEHTVCPDKDSSNN